MTKYEQNQTNKVMVGLSGGVDSAVTAMLLKERGFEVIGCYMKNWEEDHEITHCSADQDLNDAKAVCDQLDIPLITVNFSNEYWNNVFQYCLDEFVAGRTPNPDIWCNREIKFKAFLNYALDQGVNYLATGHYATITKSNDEYQLVKSNDINKDQTYFLYTLNQKQLGASLFPIGEFQKTEIREHAKKAGLMNHAKKDSTGICFIGERKFKDFLSDFLLAQPGKMETPDGKVIGTHDGIMFYTIGQRKGLNIGGRKNTPEEPWYVLAKNVKENILIVDQGQDHPLLYNDELICEQLQWISGNPPETNTNCSAKIRYRQADQPCQIEKLAEDRYRVQFENPQRAITPGQSVVFYQENTCLGGGIIA